MPRIFTAYIFWTLVAGLGLIALMRWFHPATFSVRTMLLVAVVAFAVGLPYIKRQS